MGNIEKKNVIQQQALKAWIECGKKGTTQIVTGLGKAQPLTSNILTPNGFKKMKDIKVNDFVISNDGYPTRVLGVFPQGLKDIYELTFNDGSKARSCKEHLWSVHTRNQRSKSKDKFYTLELNEIINSIDKQYFIPITEPVKLSERKYIIHPYIMGILISDGCISQKNVVSFTTVDKEIVTKIANLLPNDTKLSKNKISYIFRRKYRNNKVCSIVNEINKYNLSGCKSYNKYIPDDYLYGSIHDRIELLKGLMDGDGWVDINKKSTHSTGARYGTTSVLLKNNIITLINSLGGTCKYSKKRTFYKYKGLKKRGLDFYTICIKLPEDINPFFLKRKKNIYYPPHKYKPLRYIIDIKKVGIEEAQCIYIENNSHLYITDNFVVTHNTFIALHALYTLPKDWAIEHYFFAEVVDRKKDLKAEIEKYNEIFDRDVLNDYNLQFATYQSAYKWKNKNIGLAIFDEIHELLTPKYSRLYRYNNFQQILGLSATIDVNHEYVKMGMTKGDMLERIAPICYTYGLDESIANGTTREMKVFIIEHKLEDKLKTIEAGSAKRKFYQTEKTYYDYWNKFFLKAIRTPINNRKRKSESSDQYHKRILKEEKAKNTKVQIGMSKRSRFLYNLPSKIIIVEALLNKIQGGTIIFSNGLDSLLKITPNVISSRNSDDQNIAIRKSYEAGDIKLLGSFRKLEQGANLPDLDNVIMMSYYSKSKSLIQRLGRLRENGKEGNVFIILTKNTQEEKWFDKMFENINNLNLIYCKGIKDCLEQI